MGAEAKMETTGRHLRVGSVGSPVGLLTLIPALGMRRGSSDAAAAAGLDIASPLSLNLVSRAGLHAIASGRETERDGRVEQGMAT